MSKHFHIGTIKKQECQDYDEVHIDQDAIGHYGRIIVYGTEKGTRNISGKPLAQLIVKLLNQHYAELDSVKACRKTERKVLRKRS